MPPSTSGDRPDRAQNPQDGPDDRPQPASGGLSGDAGRDDLGDLTAEFVALRAEVRSETSHLDGLIRSEIGRFGGELSAQLERASVFIGSGLSDRCETALRRLLAAQLVTVAIAVVIVLILG